MARTTVGGTTDDLLYAVDGAGDLKAVSGTLRWYDAPTGGNQLTDLLLAGQAVTEITVPRNGRIPVHQWPDGVTSAYADTGLPDRVLVERGSTGGVSSYNDLTDKPTIPAATPDASTTTPGKVRRSTAAEVDDGTDVNAYVTPARVKARIDALRSEILGGAGPTADTLTELFALLQSGDQADQTSISNLLTVVGQKANITDLPAAIDDRLAAYHSLRMFGVYYPEVYGAKGDGKSARDTSIAAGSKALTVTGGSFTSADEGKAIVLTGAGAAAGPLKTTIEAVTDATHVTVATAATTAVTAGDATWGTDDTAALQAWADAVVAVKGVGRLASRTYLFTHLDINGSGKFEGNSVAGIYGNFADGIYNFTPLVFPFLTGSVLKCLSNSQAEAIRILGESRVVNLADFGLTWASPLKLTGHGISSRPGASKNGLASPHWFNVLVWGNDGDSYGFDWQNMTQGTFEHLRSWGGGQFSFLQQGGSEYGNATWVGCIGKTLAGGTAHAWRIFADKDCTRFAYIGCESNAVNGRGYASLARYDFVNPTAAQSLFSVTADKVRGFSWVGGATDVANTVMTQPVWPNRYSNGGVFIDPGGFYKDVTFEDQAIFRTPSGGVLAGGITGVGTHTADLTLTSTAVGTVRFMDATSSARSVVLPDPTFAKGRDFRIEKIDASANAVTVSSAGTSKQINRAATYVLSTQDQFVHVISDGAMWRIIGKG